MRKLLSFILLFLIPNIIFAVNTITCAPTTVKIQNNNIILPGIAEPRTTKLYFFKNMSKQSLWIDHPVQHPSASAGWSSYLRPGNWSVLLLSRKNFTISCAVIQPDKVSYQNCAKSVHICAPKTMALDVKRKGSYWIAEDMGWDDLLTTLEKKLANQASLQQDGKM